MLQIIIKLISIQCAYYQLEKEEFSVDKESGLFIEQCYDCMTYTRKHHKLTYQNVENFKDLYLYYSDYKKYREMFFSITRTLIYEIKLKKADKINSYSLSLLYTKKDYFIEIHDDEILQFFAKYSSKDFIFFIESFFIIHSYYKNKLNGNEYITKEIYHSLKKNTLKKIINLKKVRKFLPDIFKLSKIYSSIRIPLYINCVEKARHLIEEITSLVI